jgi:hypothetical protein
MATTEQMEQWLESLYAARASGVQMVHHGDTSTSFRSMAEIDKAINAVEQALGKTMVRSYRFVSDKDL